MIETIPITVELPPPTVRVGIIPLAGNRVRQGVEVQLHCGHRTAKLGVADSDVDAAVAELVKHHDEAFPACGWTVDVQCEHVDTEPGDNGQPRCVDCGAQWVPDGGDDQ